MLPVPGDSYVIVEYVQDWQTLKDGTLCVVITKNDGIVFKMVTAKSKKVLSCYLFLYTTYKPYKIPVSEILEIWKYHSYWTEGELEPSSSMDQILKKIEDLQEEIKAIAKTR